MMYALLIILVVFSMLYLYKRTKNKKKFIFILGFLLILFLIATGRAHWLTALIVGLIPIIKKLFILFRYAPLIKKFTSAYNKRSSSMSKKEAAEILDINIDATREEIIFAHKKAIQKNHPDKGGTSEIAAKINKARDKLLG